MLTAFNKTCLRGWPAALEVTQARNALSNCGPVCITCFAKHSMPVSAQSNPGRSHLHCAAYQTAESSL